MTPELTTQGQPVKMLNVGDIVYQFDWRDFKGSAFERTVECIVYYEKAKPKDCFYRYHLAGFGFNIENVITNHQLGSKWFKTREDAERAMNAEIAKAKADNLEFLKKEIAELEAKLAETTSVPF